MQLSRITLLVFGILLASLVQAQDTTVVQTLTFDSTSRAGTWMFPPDTGQTYRKIIMQYKMRCHNAAVGNGNVGCREWDYSCNTIIRDSSQKDSAASTHPTHLISGFSGPSFDYSFSPTYDYFAYTQQQVVYNSVISEVPYAIGTATTTAHTPFQATIPHTKSQYLYRASELTGAGLTAGPLTGLRLDLSVLGSDLRFLRIRLRPTTQTDINEVVPPDASWTEVYFIDTQIPATGSHTFPFYQNFNWNGTDNVIVEFSYSLNGSGNDYVVQQEVPGFASGVVSSDWDGYGKFDGLDDKVVWAPGGTQQVTNMTVEFWARVREMGQVQYSSFFNTGSSGRDFQIDLDGNDNIRLLGDYRNGVFGPATGEWQHIAVSFNGNGVRTDLYLNGVKVDSVSGAPDNIIQDITIGENRSGAQPIKADIDEVRVWNVVRTPAEIQANMRQRLSGNEPGLFLYWRLDDTQANPAADASPNGRIGTKYGNMPESRHAGKDIFKGLVPTAERPQATFLRGNYNMTVTPVNVLDSVQISPRDVSYFGVSGTDLDTLAQFQAWSAGWQYVYNEAGMVTDSVFAAVDSTLNIGTLSYFRKQPMDLEIMSFVTPYGNGLDLGPDGEMWEFDVTDFAPALKGPVYMYMNRGGQFQEEMDIRFLLIEGTPPRDVLSIRNIWPIPGILGQPGNNYANYAADLIQEPRNVFLPPNEEFWKIRTMVTGHGQEGEFIPRTHYMNLNGGAPEWSWLVWTECSEVPVYPQGGTWLFDRTGWCPGDPTDLEEFPLDGYVNAGDSVEIDYGINTITNPGDTRYITSHLLVGYGAPNFSLDAAVTQVKRPSNRTQFARYNPACTQPVVIIRNEGSDTLTSLAIDYKVRGGATASYNWTGSLAFLEFAEVTLPISNPGFWSGGTANVFEVTLSQPNGGVDQNAFNDSYASEYEPWANYQGGLEVNWKTNNNGNQTSWKVFDETGSVVAQNTPFIGPNLVLNEALTLPAGCYTLRFDDSADDGLYYWFTPQNGSGYARISEFGVTQQNFENEFGGFFQHDFWTDGLEVGTEDSSPSKLTVYPNPSPGSFNVRMEGFENRSVRMEVFDMTGRPVWATPQLDLGGAGFAEEVVDLSGFANGTYLLKIWDGSKMRIRHLQKM